MKQPAGWTSPNYLISRYTEHSFMLGILIVYPLFLGVCLAALFRPWIGLVGFYGCVLLEPNWNWRWSIPPDFPFQKYIVASTLIGFLLAGLRGNRLSGSSLAAVVALLSYLVITFVSLQQTIDVRLSEFYWDSVWKIVLMAILAIVLLDEPRKVWICLVVMVLMQGYSAFRINEQYFSDGVSIYAHRAWGTKGDNNLYSNLTVPIIACSASVCIFAKKQWLWIGAGIIFIFQLHQLMLLESRGAMLATVGMMAIFAWYMPRTKFTIWATALALIIGAGLAGPPVVKEFTSSFQAEGERDASADSRFKLWKAGWEITLDYPVLGVGPYAGQRLVPQYYEGYGEGTVKGLHNLFFEITTGSGVVAAIFYFSFFLIPWYLSWRHIRLIGNNPDAPDWLRAILLSVVAGIPGYLAASVFSSGSLIESSYLLASLSLAANSIFSKCGYIEASDDEVIENETGEYLDLDAPDVGNVHV